MRTEVDPPWLRGSVVVTGKICYYDALVFLSLRRMSIYIRIRIRRYPRHFPRGGWNHVAKIKFGRKPRDANIEDQYQIIWCYMVLVAIKIGHCLYVLWEDGKAK